METRRDSGGPFQLPPEPTFRPSGQRGPLATPHACREFALEAEIAQLAEKQTELEERFIATCEAADAQRRVLEALRAVAVAAKALTDTEGAWHGDGTPTRVRAVDALDEALDALAALDGPGAAEG